jgi:iron(III) transport system ATP-binding protein
VSTLVVEGLAKAYGATPVLRDVSLTVPTGGFAAVLGPSGSGKTTLLRLIAGFDRPAAGRIALDGEILDDTKAHVPAHRRRIGYVPQDGLLFPHLSVAENVGFGLPRGSRKGPRVDQLLALIGLGDYARRRPHELSGGQQQRVAVARALAPGPRLVLLDEPFAALDAGLRDTLRLEIRHVLTSLGTTVVLVTHDQEEALSLADSVAILNEGRILQHSAPRRIYESPESLGVAQFLGSPNLLAARIHGDVATTALGDLAIEPDSSRPASHARVLIRPEQIVLTPAGQSTGAGRRARVLSVTYFGHDAVARLAVECDDGELELTARTRGDQTPSAGGYVSVAFDGFVRVYGAGDESGPRRPAG